uniref:Uncharacterized protein n=1 Tax=Strigamia maritima TaxID=126957 RepID=T1J385_STRMM
MVNRVAPKSRRHVFWKSFTKPVIPVRATKTSFVREAIQVMERDCQAMIDRIARRQSMKLKKKHKLNKCACIEENGNQFISHMMIPYSNPIMSTRTVILRKKKIEMDYYERPIECLITGKQAYRYL